MQLILSSLAQHIQRTGAASRKARPRDKRNSRTASDLWTRKGKSGERTQRAARRALEVRHVMRRSRVSEVAPHRRSTTSTRTVTAWAPTMTPARRRAAAPNKTLNIRNQRALGPPSAAPGLPPLERQSQGRPSLRTVSLRTAATSSTRNQLCGGESLA